MQDLQDANSTNKLRLVAACIAGAALSAVFVKFGQGSCRPCNQASFLAPIPHLEILGAAFYALLGLALWRFKLNRYTVMAIYFAVGCHSALVYKLLKAHVYCVPCMVCAGFATAAGLIVIKRFNRFAYLAIFSGMITMYGAHSITTKIAQYDLEKKTKLAIHFENLDLTTKKGLPLYVFKHDSCGHCRDFLKNDLPKLRIMYGSKLNIHLEEAPPGVAVPTLIVGGNNPVVHVGKASLEELFSLIDGRLDNSGRDLASSLSL